MDRTVPILLMINSPTLPDRWTDERIGLAGGKRDGRTGQADGMGGIGGQAPNGIAESRVPRFGMFAD